MGYGYAFRKVVVGIILLTMGIVLGENYKNLSDEIMREILFL